MPQLVLGDLLSGFFEPFVLVLQNTESLFLQLLNYHDPELASHLDTIGFSPDHYIVPWFMTLFARTNDRLFFSLHTSHVLFLPFTDVLPMEQLYVCWDVLVQGCVLRIPEKLLDELSFSSRPSVFPLFIALAIMISLRDILLARDVTGCMLFFANVLTIDMVFVFLGGNFC